MFRYLRVKKQPEKIPTAPGELSLKLLVKEGDTPLALRHLNGLAENLQKRIYRLLLPPALMQRFDIDPLNWKGPDGSVWVDLHTEMEAGLVRLSVRHGARAVEPFITIELSDNALNGIDLNLLLLGHPESARYKTDVDESGEPTLFGTVRRNLAEELRAMQAGLAPGQTQSSLGASRLVLDHLEVFLTMIGQRAIFLEPLTYASAWVFERRGFAYVRGHKLMDDINREFQPGGCLYTALDGSTPFRKPEQWNSVRGRAWAIQDGILQAMDARWDGLRMVKQIGRHSGVQTYPGAVY